MQRQKERHIWKSVLRKNKEKNTKRHTKKNTQSEMYRKEKVTWRNRSSMRH